MHVLYVEKWDNPSITGCCIPPASGFVLEKIDNTRAVLFGGREYGETGNTYSNDIYLLVISDNDRIVLVCYTTMIPWG